MPRVFHTMTDVDEAARQGVCSACGPVDVVRRSGGWACAEMRRRIVNRSYSSNPTTSARYHRSLRERVIDALGGRCACVGCDVDEPRFLTVDHVHGIEAHPGHVHPSGRRRGDVMRLIWREGCPTDKYRLLCANCHQATKDGRTCPHTETH